jgi:fucose 4-O-acetylase-like acetyltransferase
MLAAETSINPETGISILSIGPWQIASFWKSMILELCRCAVPLFLFITGYYMLSMPRTWKAVLSTCRRLVIPMGFWSLAGWAFSWRNGANGWSILDFIAKLITGTSQLGYFFIVLIVQYYIISMWLVPAMAKKPRLVLMIVLSLQLAVHVYDYIYYLSQLRIINPVGCILESGPFPEHLFPRFIFSFALGIWAATSNKIFKKILVDQFNTISFITIVTALLLALERGIIFSYGWKQLGMNIFDATAISWVEWKASTTMWTIAAIFFFPALFHRRIPLENILKYLGKNSFFIFLLHGMVMQIIMMIMYKYCIHMHFYGFIGTFLIFAIGIGAPVLIVKLLQRYTPSFIRALLLGT